MKKNNKNKNQRAVLVKEKYNPVVDGPFDWKKSQVIQHRSIRLLNAGGNQTITLTVDQLAQICVGVVATTAILGYYEANSFRIKRTRIWAVCPPSGAAATVSAAYATGVTGSSQPMFGGPPTVVTSTTTSISKYAYIDLRPNRNTGWQDKWWSVVTSNSGQVLNLTLPDECVIQFDFDTFQDALGVRTVSPLAIAGATAGTWYSSFGTTGLVAQGQNSI